MSQISYAPRQSYVPFHPSARESITNIIASYEGVPAMHDQNQHASPANQEAASLAQQIYNVSVSSSQSPQFTYAQNLTNYFTPTQQPILHTPDNFLQLYRPQTQFIDEAEQIEDLIKETFQLTTNQPLPKDIIIRILDKGDMQRVHENSSGGQWNNNIQGFSINSKPLKQVFVKKGDLDRVMLVLGHEIGHVLTPSAMNKHDEEAKAFAFECAWMKTIVKHNIANLKENINLDFKPANNGLHDVACNFVKQILAQGEEALDTYWKIAKRKIKTNIAA